MYPVPFLKNSKTHTGRGDPVSRSPSPASASERSAAMAIVPVTEAARLRAQAASCCPSICGRCDPAILAVVTVTTGGGYLAAVLLRRCEQRQKETLVDCDRKMNYLENEGQSLQAARELRLYDMAGLFSGLP